MAHPKALRDAVLERVALGHSLRTICDTKGMPDYKTVMRWVDADPDYCQRYARAKQQGLEAMAEDILHIANTPQMGVIRTVKADGGIEEKTVDMIEHRRLQVDARKWILAKLAPKKYGEKLALAGDQESPLQVVVQRLTGDGK